MTLLLAFGRGLQRQMIINAAGIGDQICIAWPGPDVDSVRGARQGTQDPPLRGGRRGDPAGGAGIDRDLERVLADPEARTTRRRRWRSTSRASRRSSAACGTSIPQAGGRFINPIDVTEERRVLFIGNKLAQDIFGRTPAVGKTVLLGGSPFLVVGVLQKKVQQSSYSGRDDGKAFMPGSTFRALTGEKWVDNLIYQPAIAARERGGDRRGPRDAGAPAALRHRRQGGALRVGHDGAVRVLRRLFPVVPSLPRDHRVVHPHRRRNRRLEHHERRRRGADTRGRHQDGSRRPAKWILRQFLLETILITRAGRRDRLRGLLRGLRHLSEVRRDRIRREIPRSPSRSRR